VLETFSANGGYGMDRKRTVGRWTIRLALASSLLLAGMTAAVTGAAGPEQPGGGNPNGAGDGATKAAFIRNQNLWVKSGGQERQLTEGDKAHKPLWSADGQWIAYTSGDNTIKLHHPATGRNVEIGTGTNAQWSPTAAMLAFQDGEVLQVTDAAKAESEKFQNASLGVGNYSWLPDGSGFLVSTLSRLQPDGWSDISLYEVPFAYGQDPQKGRLITSFPSMTKSFFAVTTGDFQWSADRKWVRFIAKPTASLSADSDTLCVMYWGKKKIMPAGETLNRDDWAVWSPEGDMLAYIGGGGRDATANKKLTMKRPPFRKPTVYTPQGFADRDPAWVDGRTIIVSRVKESSGAGDTPPPQRTPPFLASVSVQDESSAAITSPEGAFGAYSPAYIPASRQLTWIRTDGTAASAWIGGADGSGAREWIGALDLAPDYYGQQYWDDVIDRYGAAD
jgi:dipeptidyl aminopeptidase/acylaminoacyl peptidase